jgi:hypothetical protein
MKRTKQNHCPAGQAELFGLVWRPYRNPFRLRAGDVIRFDGRLGLVIRVNECAAVILMNRTAREFTTRFDKRVRFQPKPALFRICSNSEVEILNRKKPKAPRFTRQD